MEDLTGKQLGPYQIVAPLGEGGMAAVYRAYQPAMERYVALKILPRHFADDPTFAARFQREAKLLAQLQHSHILPVFDYGQADGYSYIVMPFIPSGTLADSMQGKPLPFTRIRQVISQVGDALNYAHGHGMVHRDVKPSNVLIDESGSCLLTDFGLARMVEGSAHLTATGTIMGTPAYMAPEQGSGHKIDERSDIYSLGVILYEMATGRVPYRAETPVAVVYMHISAPLPLPRSVNPDLPEAVERVILKALAKNPDERYQTAEELVAALDRAIAETPTVTSVSETPPKTEATYVGVGPTLSAPMEEPAGMAIAPLTPKRRVPGWALALTVGVVALLAAGGIYFANRAMGPSASAIALASPTTASALPSASLPVQAMPLPASSPALSQSPTKTVPAPLPGRIVVPLDSLGTGIPWLTLGPDASPGIHFVAFNVESIPFKSVLVRQAFAHAIDRQMISDMARRYKARNPQSATTLTPPIILGRDLYNEVGNGYDPQLAKELFVEAGYTDASAFPAVTLMVNSYGDIAPGARFNMAKAMAEMWKTTLGVEVKVLAVGPADYKQRLADDMPEMYWLGWVADYGDPDDFLREIFQSGSQYNYGGYASIEFNQLVDQAAKLTDPEQRQELYIRAERLLCEQDAALIPLYHTN
jgi:hypothetical protein